MNVVSWTWNSRAQNILEASTSKMEFQYGRGLIGAWSLTAGS